MSGFVNPWRAGSENARAEDITHDHRTLLLLLVEQLASCNFGDYSCSGDGQNCGGCSSCGNCITYGGSILPDVSSAGDCGWSKWVLSG